MSYVLSGISRRLANLGASDIIRREAYADLELDAKVELLRALVPLGLLHRSGVARPGGDGARRRSCTLGRTSRSRGAVTAATLCRWAGGAACADSCAPHSPHRGERDPAAILRGDAWRSGRGRPAAEAGVVRDLLPQLRGRRRGDSRGDRVVEFDGVPWLHPGQRGAAAGVPGAGPVRRGRGGRVPGRQDVRRRDDGHRAGHHADGGEALPRLRRNGHGERDGADAVPAVVGRAGPRPLPGRAGDPRWRQGAPHGRQEGLPEPGPGATVSVAQAPRTW